MSQLHFLIAGLHGTQKTGWEEGKQNKRVSEGKTLVQKLSLTIDVFEWQPSFSGSVIEASIIVC